jgi:uncharacterized membrane protein YgaE (UPF0421/DUF939 family)
MKRNITEQDVRKAVNEGIRKVLKEYHGAATELTVGDLVQLLQNYPQEAKLYKYERSINKYLRMTNDDVQNMYQGQVVVIR